MPEVIIGKINEFFARKVVAGIELSAPLKTGDLIHIIGHTTDVLMTVQSMQIDSVLVTTAGTGQSVDVKVAARVRKGDTVYKVNV